MRCQQIGMYSISMSRRFSGFFFGDDVPWCAAGIGPNQIVLNKWSVSNGGHARTGFEDNIRLDKTTLAPSNAALVGRVVELCDRNERPVASPQQARAILGIS